MYPSYMILLIFALAGISQASYTDPECLEACSDWSVVLGYCRIIYGNEPGQKNATYANQFVNCCCNGEELDKTLGREKIAASVGLCQSCASTPPMVRKDLSQLLEFCVIQEAYGDTENATLFKPLGYSTSNNIANAGTSLQTSAAVSRSSAQSREVILLVGVGVLIMCVSGRSLF